MTLIFSLMAALMRCFVRYTIIFSPPGEKAKVDDGSYAGEWGESIFLLLPLLLIYLEKADHFSEISTSLRLMDANVSCVIGSVPQIQINACFAKVILSCVRTAVFLYVRAHVCVCLGNVNEELRRTLLSHNAVWLDLQTTH